MKYPKAKFGYKSSQETTNFGAQNIFATATVLFWQSTLIECNVYNPTSVMNAALARSLLHYAIASIPVPDVMKQKMFKNHAKCSNIMI